MNGILIDEGRLLVYDGEKQLSLVVSINFDNKTAVLHDGCVVPYTHLVMRVPEPDRFVVRL